MSWRWISIAAMLAALVVGFGALSNRDAEDTDSATTSEQPAFYAKDAIVLQTQEDGSPQLRLVANRIDQRVEDDSILLRDVRVDYLKVPNKLWILNADQGAVPADSRVIAFSGNVQLHPADATPDAFLRTDALTVDTERNLAYTTASPTSMQYGRYIMRVKRLQADLKTEKVTLEAVHGRSEPRN
jgi:LPS export ABC transporter protein LptC